MDQGVVINDPFRYCFGFKYAKGKKFQHLTTIALSTPGSGPLYSKSSWLRLLVAVGLIVVACGMLLRSNRLFRDQANPTGVAMGDEE